jgi:hypothetical protein
MGVDVDAETEDKRCNHSISDTGGGSGMFGGDELLLKCSELCTILGNPRRLRIIDILADLDGRTREIEKNVLAREIARREVGAETVGDVATDEYESAMVGIHQAHLPKLEDYGIINRDRNRISPGPDFDRALLAFHAIALSYGLPADPDLGGVSDEQ